MKKRMTAFLIAMMIMIVFAVAGEKTAFPAGAETVNTPVPGEIVPTCEIKLLLDNDLVLDENHLLRESILEELRIDRDYETIEAAYLDTPGRDYLEGGWVNRLQLKEGKKKYTITYKKRYSVADGGLDAALTAAEGDGFFLDDPQFPAEVDWEYSAMTLSFSEDVEIELKDNTDAVLPPDREAAKNVAEYMPPREKQREGTRTDAEIAENLEVIGPLEVKRYSGSMEENFRVEIWEVPGNGKRWYITEFSIECASVEEAAALRDSVLERLDAMGILKHENGLKTEMILNAPDTAVLHVRRGGCLNCSPIRTAERNVVFSLNQAGKNDNLVLSDRNGSDTIRSRKRRKTK